MGDITQCTSGLTVMFWLRIPQEYANTYPIRILSSGTQLSKFNPIGRGLNIYRTKTNLVLRLQSQENIFVMETTLSDVIFGKWSHLTMIYTYGKLTGLLQDPLYVAM